MMKILHMGIVLLAMLMVSQAPALAAPSQAPASTLNHRVYLAMVMRPIVLIPPPPPPVSFEDQVIDLTNQRRAAAGCLPVLKNLQLTNAAEAHSQDMASRNFFSHTGSNGSTGQIRVQRAGYPGFLFGGENIAAGQTTPAYVVDAWMNSPGHRANILNCSFKSVGIGYVYEPGDAFGPYRHYWTQVFGLQ